MPRVAGHTLKLVPTGKGRSATGVCKCGRWEETGKTQAEVKRAYQDHLRDAKESRTLAGEELTEREERLLR